MIIIYFIYSPCPARFLGDDAVLFPLNQYISFTKKLKKG